MNPIGWAILITICMVVTWAIEHGTANNSGKRLHAKFAELGTLAGRTRDDIVAVVGPPSSMSRLAEGRVLLQWQAAGCHMALMFRDDTCQGVSHQFVQQG